MIELLLIEANFFSKRPADFTSLVAVLVGKVSLLEQTKTPATRSIGFLKWFWREGLGSYLWSPSSREPSTYAIAMDVQHLERLERYLRPPGIRQASREVAIIKVQRSQVWQSTLWPVGGQSPIKQVVGQVQESERRRWLSKSQWDRTLQTIRELKIVRRADSWLPSQYPWLMLRKQIKSRIWTEMARCWSCYNILQPVVSSISIGSQSKRLGTAFADQL